MKRFGIMFLVAVLFLGQIGTVAYGANDDNETSENLNEKYEILRQENKRMRNEILRLNNKLSKEKAKKIPVLLYHHLLEQSDIDTYGWSNNGSVLSVESFEKQMKYLYENGFYTATLDELQSFLDGKISLPEKTVVITFDDGYLTNGIYAYPIMKKYNFRGTIFMIGHRVDAPQRLFDPSDTQSISIKRAYRYTDVFDFESHTYDLHGKDENKIPVIISSDENTILDDLVKIKDLVGAKYFAYPYGAHNEDTIEYLKQTGYEMAFTVKPDYVTKESDKYELPRFPIAPYTTFDRFVQIVNGK